MSSVIDDKTVLKIKRLLALSKSSNEHEAALAASRAQELLFKHKIEMATVDSAVDPKHINSEPAEGKEYEYAPRGKRTQGWRLTLLTSTATNNFCKLVILGRGEDRASMVIGRPSDIEVVKYVHGYLIQEIDRLARESGARAREEFKRSGDHVDAYRWYMSFCDGATETVKTRLYEQRKNDEQRVITQSEVMALVRREDQNALDKMNQMYPNLRPLNMTSRTRDEMAKMEGRKAGERISLKKGIKE